MKHIYNDLNASGSKKHFGALDIFKYIGPGLLVTVGFIDPGNWATNIAGGSEFGYLLLWVITLSTIMLIVLQHNVAHLGIATGLCLSEATNKYLPKWLGRPLLGTAMAASVSTSLAELLGAAIALNMLWDVPIMAGATLTAIFVSILILSNSYRKIEKWIIGFVSLIGLSFIYELSLVHINWGEAAVSWVTPNIPHGSIMLIMSLLGAVVMPHNLFLHSEVIQSRQWNLKDDKVIKRQLDFELFDTLFAMIIGWAINSAMILLAATVFFSNGVIVNELQQASDVLKPLLGPSAAIVFALALLFSGLASSTTSGMAGGSIFAGMFGEPFHVKDNHSRTGVVISLFVALIVIFMIRNPFKGLLVSQMILSIQLPITIFLQIYLTTSKKVMGKYANKPITLIMLSVIGLVVTFLNILLFISFF
ncbi:MAG: Nramp family divalent metal transporter [Bacteroidota bacterium]